MRYSASHLVCRCDTILYVDLVVYRVKVSLGCARLRFPGGYRGQVGVRIDQPLTNNDSQI